MKKAIISLMLLTAFSSSTVYAAKKLVNCGQPKPTFYDEVEKTFGSKYAADSLGWQVMNEYLDKPVPFEVIESSVIGWSIRDLCIYGTENNKKVEVQTNMLIQLSPEYSKTGKVQILAVETGSNIDPDRNTSSLTYREKIIDLTQVLSSMQK